MFKKLTILLVLFSVIGYAAAEVTAKLIDVTSDNKAISVWVNYQLNGQNVSSPYPPINGWPVKRFRLTYRNLANKTNEQILQYIVGNVKQHCRTIIAKEFQKKADAALVTNKLSNYIGANLTVENVTIKIDEWQDWVIYDNGTKTVINH